jgi:site-specific DNA recombinase
MKAALYIRVSTEEQVDGFSLSAQMNLLTDYCKKENIEVGKVYADEGVSGQKENRPQFQKMLKDAENNLFNIILVHKYDRFARKVELSQRVKNQLKKNNINVVSITEPLEDSPMGFFVGGLHDLLAEYYVRNLAQESKKGHVERAKQGYHNGSVPYGYKLDKLTGDMVINEPQAEIVRLIFSLYNEKGYGSTKIAGWLNQRKMPSAVNGEWAHYTVNRVLKNVKYIGKIEYDGEVYEGKHEPIITDIEFKLAQSNIKERTWKRSYRGANFEKFALLGLMKCGYCGRVMRAVVTFTKNRVHSRYYFICNGLNHGSLCENSRYHQSIRVENAVMDKIRRFAEKKDPDIKIKKRFDIDSTLKSQRAKIEQETDRAKAAYLSGAFTLEEYIEIKTRCEASISKLESEIEGCNEESQRESVINKILSTWDELQAEESPSRKRMMLQTYIEAILIYKNDIDILFYL